MFTSDNSENTNNESGKKNFIQFYDFSEKKKKELEIIMNELRVKYLKSI